MQFFDIIVFEKLWKRPQIKLHKFLAARLNGIQINETLNYRNGAVEFYLTNATDWFSDWKYLPIQFQ